MTLQTAIQAAVSAADEGRMQQIALRISTMEAPHVLFRTNRRSATQVADSGWKTLRR
jgi:hypothetical protein